MRSSLAIALALALLLLASCGPTRHPTPGGLQVELERGAVITPERAELIDRIDAAVRECLPPEAFCRHDMPVVMIVGQCRAFRAYGTLYQGHPTTRGVRVAGPLWVLGHELGERWYTCERTPSGAHPECGDGVDHQFRPLLPAAKCEVTQ